MKTVKNKFKNIRNEHLRSIYKDTNFILSLKQPKNCIENWHLLDSFQVLKTLANQELLNVVAKDVKYVKII